MLSGFCPASFGVLFGSLVPGYRHTPLTTGPSSQWCPVSNWGVFECDISHRRSVAVLCMRYKIRCYPVHPLNGALPGPYVPARVTRIALVAHRYTYAPPRCRTFSFRKGEHACLQDKIHIHDWFYFQNTVRRNMEICD